MSKPRKTRLLALTAAALLLAGSGGALHHSHERVADCLAGSCLEHASHAAPQSAISDDKSCPVCEMRGHHAAAAPTPAPGTSPLPAAHAAAAERPAGMPTASWLLGLFIRGPPRLS